MINPVTQIAGDEVRCPRPWSEALAEAQLPQAVRNKDLK